MTMKKQDVAVAVSLLIQGYLRANNEAPSALPDAIAMIRREADDWAENLGLPAGLDANALEPSKHWSVNLSINQADVPRTPYNLQSAALVLLAESIDLNGPEAVEQLSQRIADVYGHVEAAPGEA